ncbi:MAG: hypothetical protein WD904_00095 [Dehalococcoidia bacterium]
MIRKITVVALSLVVSVGVLYSSAAPAAACSCAFITDPDQIRRDLEEWSDFVVVEGIIAAPEGVSVENMRIPPEIAYWGDPPAEIVLDQTWLPPYHENSGTYDNLGADCSYSLTGEEGDPYLLSLIQSETDPSTYSALGCGSYPLVFEAPPEGYTNPYQDAYNALIAATNGGTPVRVPELASPTDPAVAVISDRVELWTGTDVAQADSDHEKDTPWAVVLPLAFAIPLATLLLPTFLRKRSGGH